MIIDSLKNASLYTNLHPLFARAFDYLKNENETNLDWDYILIDEAQDWEEEEKEILFKIYGPNRILVADGIDQFMRSTKKIDFGKGLNNSEKRCIKL